MAKASAFKNPMKKDLKLQANIYICIYFILFFLQQLSFLLCNINVTHLPLLSLNSLWRNWPCQHICQKPAQALQVQCISNLGASAGCKPASYSPITACHGRERNKRGNKLLETCDRKWDMLWMWRICYFAKTYKDILALRDAVCKCKQVLMRTVFLWKWG